MFYWVVILCVLGYSVNGANVPRKGRLPPYIKPCKQSDPDFEQCCLQHGKDAFPYIIKGDRRFRIPKLSPLFVPSVTVDAGEELKIDLKNVTAYGLENTDIQQVKIDTENKKITLKVAVPKLKLIGKYEIDGKIMILPIQGKGDFNITAVDGVYEYNLEYNIEERDGNVYLSPKDNDKLNFTLGNAIFKLDNLFNGDISLGTQINTFLNENWKDVIHELGGAISHTVSTVALAITSGYFKKIPYAEIILE